MSLGGLAIFFVAQGHLDESAELTAQVLQLGEALDDTPCLINARFGMGFRAWLVGDLQEAVEELHRVVVLCDGDLLAFGDVFPWYDPGVIALAISGIVKWLLGAQSEGHHDLAVAVEAARRSAHPFKLTMILFYDALLNVMAGDAAVVIRRSEEFGALAARYGLPELVSLAGATGGWAKAGTGDVSAGVEELRRSCAGQQAVGVKLLRTFLLGALADSYRRAGLLDDALGTVDEALATAEETGERFYEPELHRLRGDFLAARWPERAGEARACGERAVAVAGRQGAVSLLRRAETAVAGR
jgi:tetratricopeptide (TPR) repeat protein